MEFEKKMYWTGHSSYLIAGIKAQYDKLKEGNPHPIQNFNKRIMSAKN